MKNILKNTAIAGSAEFAIIFVALAKNKYLALSIGPEGLGIYGLLNSFFTFASVFTGVWLSRGAIKFISEYNQASNTWAVKKVYSFSVFLCFLAATFLTAIFFLFSTFIKNKFLSPDIIFVHYALFAASFIASSLNIIFFNVLQGLKLIKKTVFTRIITSVFELVSILILVHLFDLTGFFISILLSAVFTGVILWRIIRQSIPGSFSIPDFRDKIIKTFVSFGVVNLFLVTMDLVSQYLQRVIILKYLNIFSLGIFQAATSIMRYLGIINRGSAFLYTPRHSENLTIAERSASLNEYLRFTLLTGIPIAVISILFGRQLIHLLYSNEFLILSDSFYLFVLAQLLISVELGFQAIVIGMTFLKVHTIVTIITHTLWVVVPFFFIKEAGLASIAIAFCMASIIAMLIDGVYLIRKIRIKIDKKVFLLLLTGLIAVGISVLFMHYNFLHKLIWILVSLLLLAFNISVEEWKKAYSFIRHYRK